MEAVQLDILGFVLAVITAIVGGSVSISTSAPSRSRILSDLEIIRRMREIGTTAEENTYLMILRASVGRQLKELVYVMGSKLEVTDTALPEGE